MSGELSPEEIAKASCLVYKLIQQEVFAGEEYPKLSCLSPFKDENGLIRLKTRVSNREDNLNYRFPIVLPNKHILVSRLIMEYHLKKCHAGTQNLLSLLREDFWILGGRRTIKGAINKCVICRRFEAKHMKVEPPPLPLDRVRDAVAFEVVGVDFAGPLYLKDKSKVWICLFTCGIYRAVHLELTASLSTTSFLGVLRRFVSRRGRPKTVFSDNGTNFKGAENLLATLDWDSIVRKTAVQRIEWRFNPPTAAWWGGFWERLISVLKRLLRKMLGRACLAYEDLLTVMCDCEAVINARPITYVSEDARDLVALTPSMFLRDQVDFGVPDCDALDRGSLCRNVRRIQTLREDLRSRFRIEYLGELKQLWRKKDCRPITTGEMVFVGDDHHKRLWWPLGRVLEVLPGKDGVIRLVKVTTAKGVLLRPVRRLFPLECSIEDRTPEAATVRAEEDNLEDNSPDEVTTPSGFSTRSGRQVRLPRRFLL